MIKISRIIRLISILLLSMGWLSVVVHAQNTLDKTANLSFSNAMITMDKQGKSPLDIRFRENDGLSVSSFFKAYRQAFHLSDDNEMKSFSVFTDQLKQTHYRFKQYYRGIEVADVQYLLHEKNGQVFYAHGHIIHGLNLDVVPTLSEEQALTIAIEYIGAESYMWQNEKNEAFLKKEQKNQNATFYPHGELRLSAGKREMVAENFRLVYRFDIYAQKPFGRYYVDIDAHTGEVINKISRIRHGDVQGQGLSVYNDLVAITVSDSVFPASMMPSHWHLDSWNVFGESGESWWLSDITIGNEGGYENNWYEVLDTDPIILDDQNPILSFYQRYAVEAPVGAEAPYDGWDGMNIRISVDDGETWQVLTNPDPQYSNNSLYSFGFIHGEGPGIPGWTNQSLDWAKVTIDLSSFSNQSVRLRFAFASDGGLSTSDGSPDLFGWQIDDILVKSAAETLFWNNGLENELTPRNLFREVTWVEGNYRLRETGRGEGIDTYDMMNGTSLALAQDFVDADSSFTEENAMAGVSVHWATEATYDYYLTQFGRNSIDNEGGRIISYVHYDNDWFNASWDGTRTRYGDGTGNATPLVSIDIVGHELTHGVTEYSANLIYAYEPGALNESFSDIFGEAVEAFLKGTAPDWLNGAELGALRSLADPTIFGNPDTYQGKFWVTSSSDNGGVHTNSGVQNHWFYLLSEGGSGVNDNGYVYNVEGIGLDHAEQIAYRNLTVYLMPGSQYFDAREGSMNAAIDLFGNDSPELQSVVDAWNAVGVLRPTFEANLYVSDDTLDFLIEAAVITDTETVRLSNFGLETLNISALQLSGDKYHIISDLDLPVNLSYAEGLDVTIAFNSEEVGDYIDSVMITSNDPLVSTKKVFLRGKSIKVQPAIKGVIYAVTGNLTSGQLATIDQNSGEATIIGSTGYDALNGLSIHPSDKDLFATVTLNDTTLLIRIDSETGISFIKAVIPGTQLRAITFDSNGDLYAGDYDRGQLYLINSTTGDTTLIGPTAITRLAGLTINPLDNNLWGIALPDSLFKINKYTAEADFIGKTGSINTNDIAFDKAGKLFGVTVSPFKGTSKFVQIDTTNAGIDVIGNAGIFHIQGLAIQDTVLIMEVENNTADLIPNKFNLEQNYPNPFNPKTMINYELPMMSKVNLSIYNLLGQKVANLVSEIQSAGRHKVEWDASGLSSGIYYYRIEVADPANRTSEFQDVKKMILLR